MIDLRTMGLVEKKPMRSSDLGLLVEINAHLVITGGVDIEVYRVMPCWRYAVYLADDDEYHLLTKWGTEYVRYVEQMLSEIDYSVGESLDNYIHPDDLIDRDAELMRQAKLDQERYKIVAAGRRRKRTLKADRMMRRRQDRKNRILSRAL